MSESQQLEQIARQAEKEASQLRSLCTRLHQLPNRVKGVIGSTATRDDIEILGYAQNAAIELNAAADHLFKAAKEARAAAVEAQRREEQARKR